MSPIRTDKLNEIVRRTNESNSARLRALIEQRRRDLSLDRSPLMYQPYQPSVPDTPTPLRYEPQPHYGLYEYPTSTGMAEDYPITAPGLVAAPAVTRPEEVAEDLFSEEAMARRALKQRYAESNFDNRAKSHAGAMGAWQIMPITYKDYLGRGRGKAGDLNDPEYNRKVRDWVMGIIPRDLQDLYSENDAPRVKLAKIYGAYNWGAGNMRKYLRKQRDAGVDISNDTTWVEGLNPETKRYIKYLALDEDIPDSTYTNKAFEETAAKRGYMKDGGPIHIKPSHRGRLTELKERTGKTEAELYNDGNPAHKRMVVFARNARKWHGDGGLLDRYGDDAVRAAIARMRATNKYDGKSKKSGILRRILSTVTKVPNMTGAATTAATGLRDIPLVDSTVGKELAVAGTALSAPYAVAEAPHIASVLLNPATATTKGGALLATLADASGVVDGVVGLGTDLEKAIAGTYTANDIPGTIINGTVMLPGNSLLTDARTLGNMVEAAETVGTIPRIISRNTLFNRIAHPVETYRFAELAKNAKDYLPSEIYEQSLRNLSQAPFYNRPYGETDYSIFNRTPADNDMKYSGTYDWSEVVDDPENATKYFDNGEFYSLGDRNSKNDFSRGHEFGHLIQDSALELGYIPDNKPPIGYEYYGDPRPYIQDGEYFADVVGTSITRDAATEANVGTEQSRRFMNNRYHYAIKDEPRFRKISDKGKGKPISEISPMMRKGYDIELKNYNTAISDGNMSAISYYRKRLQGQIDKLRALGVEVPDI